MLLHMHQIHFPHQCGSTCIAASRAGGTVKRSGGNYSSRSTISAPPLPVCFRNRVQEKRKVLHNQRFPLLNTLINRAGLVCAGSLCIHLPCAHENVSMNRLLLILNTWYGKIWPRIIYFFLWAATPGILWSVMPNTLTHLFSWSSSVLSLSSPLLLFTQECFGYFCFHFFTPTYPILSVSPSFSLFFVGSSAFFVFFFLHATHTVAQLRSVLATWSHKLFLGQSCTSLCQVFFFFSSPFMPKQHLTLSRAMHMPDWVSNCAKTQLQPQIVWEWWKSNDEKTLSHIIF